MIAFVNDSGVPFVEQADQLIDRAVSLKPQAVLLAGSALTGRPGKGFRRILAVQCSALGRRSGRHGSLKSPMTRVRSVQWARGRRPRQVLLFGSRRSSRVLAGEAQCPQTLYAMPGADTNVLMLPL